VLRATKVRIYPTLEQAEFLNRQFGAVRFCYNKALHIIRSQYKRHGLKLRAKKDLKAFAGSSKKVTQVSLETTTPSRFSRHASIWIKPFRISLIQS
jgi:transposase